MFQIRLSLIGGIDPFCSSFGIGISPPKHSIMSLGNRSVTVRLITVLCVFSASARNLICLSLLFNRFWSSSIWSSLVFICWSLIASCRWIFLLIYFFYNKFQVDAILEDVDAAAFFLEARQASIIKLIAPTGIEDFYLARTGNKRRAITCLAPLTALGYIIPLFLVHPYERVPTVVAKSFQKVCFHILNASKCQLLVITILGWGYGNSKSGLVNQSVYVIPYWTFSSSNECPSRYKFSDCFASGWC